MAAGDVFKVRMGYVNSGAGWSNTIHVRENVTVSGDDFEALSDTLRGPAGYGPVWRDLIGTDTRWICNRITRVDPAPRISRVFRFSEPLIPIPLIPTTPIVLGNLFEFWAGDDEPTANGHIIVAGLSALNNEEGLPTTLSILNLDDVRTFFLNFMLYDSRAYEHVLLRKDRTGYDRITECLFRAEVIPYLRRTPRQCGGPVSD